MESLVFQLVSCSRCKGFLAFALRACPHCHAPLDRARQALVGLASIAGGGAVSMTLMACYGAPCVDDGCRYVPDDGGNPSQVDAGTDASDAGSDTGDASDASDANDAATDGATDGATDASSDASANAADGS